eukprot:scaffold121169_cov60-Phaeocystis_antarctica.AAC.1
MNGSRTIATQGIGAAQGVARAARGSVCASVSAASSLAAHARGSVYTASVSAASSLASSQRRTSENSSAANTAQSSAANSPSALRGSAAADALSVRVDELPHAGPRGALPLAPQSRDSRISPPEVPSGTGPREGGEVARSRSADSMPPLDEDTGGSLVEVSLPVPVPSGQRPGASQIEIPFQAGDRAQMGFSPISPTSPNPRAVAQDRGAEPTALSRSASDLSAAVTSGLGFIYERSPAILGLGAAGRQLSRLWLGDGSAAGELAAGEATG